MLTTRTSVFARSGVSITYIRLVIVVFALLSSFVFWQGLSAYSKGHQRPLQSTQGATSPSRKQKDKSTENKQGARTAGLTCAYAINFSESSTFATKLYKLDANTGANLGLVNINPVVGPSIGLELGSNGLLYTVTTWGGLNDLNSLISIDPVTGTAQVIGPLGSGLNQVLEGDLAFDGSGTLFGISKNTLFTINLSNGQATIKGTVPPLSAAGFSRDISELAFDSTGTLYAIDNQNPAGTQTTLLKLNPNNAAIISSTIITPNLPAWGGMDFDPGSGLLYVADGAVGVTSKLYKLNPITGVMTVIGPTGITPGISGLVLCPAPVQLPCVDPPNTTMVAWYPFDESVGTVAANLATGNSGTLNNSPTHIPGKVAGALRFDGINDYVDAPSTIVTNIGPAGLPSVCGGGYSTCRGDFSIDAWIKVDPTAINSAISIVNKGGSSGATFQGYEFSVYQRKKLGISIADGTGFGYTTYSSPVIVGLTTDWHHVAVTVSRRTSPAGINFYDNGILIGSADPTGTVFGPPRYGSLANSNPLRIGGTSWLGYWFKGNIDELEIFNRELTPAEVQGIYNAGPGGKCK